MKKILVCCSGDNFVADHLTAFLEAAEMQVTTCDLRDPRKSAALAAALTNDEPECVINLTDIPFAARGERESYRQHILLNDTIIDTVNNYGAHADAGDFLYVNVAPYVILGGLGNESGTLDERSCCIPSSLYGAAMAATHSLALSNRFTLPTVAVLHSSIYGTGQPVGENVISYVIARILQRKAVLLNGSGKYSRDFLYIKDFCEGMLRVIQSARIGECYCLGSGVDTSLVEAATAVCNVFNSEGHIADLDATTLIKFGGGRASNDLRRVLNYSKAHKEIGFEPSYNLEQGIRDFVAAVWTAHVPGIDVSE
jgi:dTDP-glucose 4,6-dehydratase